jgi:hypothetical protein
VAEIGADGFDHMAATLLSRFYTAIKLDAAINLKGTSVANLTHHFLVCCCMQGHTGEDECRGSRAAGGLLQAGLAAAALCCFGIRHRTPWF